MTSCTTTPNRRSLSGWLALRFLAAVALPLAALAQSPTGMIIGRVFNPATGEYIRNAEIRIEGTQQLTHSEEGGYYLKARLITDINLGFKLTKHTDLYLSGRNALNSGKNWYFGSDGRMQQKERYGGQWNVGVKGNY